MSPHKDVAAFCRRFPNSVARDHKLSDVGLVVLAYRATFKDPYALNHKAARGIVRGKGLGRDAFERGVAEAKKAGYLERRQGKRKADGTFAYAIEKLNLPESPDGRVVGRSRFDGSLSVQELAAVLFLGAGVGALFARELADRFGWSRPTGAKVIKALLERGLLERSTARKADGTYTATTYTTVKKPGHGSPGHGFSGHTRREEALHVGKKETDREATSIEVSNDKTSAERGWHQALNRLLEADHARTLSGYLRKDWQGLQAFLEKHGGEQALDIMVAVLWRHVIDGKPVGSVKTWRYFDKIVLEERNKQKLAEEGIRPGDLIASHRHFLREPIN